MGEKVHEIRLALYKSIHTSHMYREIVKKGGREGWAKYLYGIMGKISCKDLTLEELVRLKDKVCLSYPLSTLPLSQRERAQSSDGRGGTLGDFEKSKASEAQIRHIAYLCKELGWTKQQADRYICKHFKISHASWMTVYIARGVIIGMKKMASMYETK